MPEEPEPPDTGNEEQPTTEQQPPGPETPDTDEKDWKAEAEKHQALARKHEQRAKSNASAVKELEKLKASMMSEQEKAVTEAEAKGRQSAVAEVGERLAAAKIETALTGVVANPAEIVEDLNLARYVTEDGDVDQEKVAALRKKYEGLAPKQDAKSSAGQRPKPALRTVPVTENGGTPMTDMNEVMRARARNA